MHEEPKGRFDRHDALPVGEIPAKLDYLDEAIGRLSADVDRVIAPFEPGLALLDAIPIDLAAKGLQGGFCRMPSVATLAIVLASGARRPVVNPSAKRRAARESAARTWSPQAAVRARRSQKGPPRLTARAVSA